MERWTPGGATSLPESPWTSQCCDIQSWWVQVPSDQHLRNWRRIIYRKIFFLTMIIYHKKPFEMVMRLFWLVWYLIKIILNNNNLIRHQTVLNMSILLWLNCSWNLILNAVCLSYSHSMWVSIRSGFSDAVGFERLIPESLYGTSNFEYHLFSLLIYIHRLSTDGFCRSG